MAEIVVLGVFVPDEAGAFAFCCGPDFLGGGGGRVVACYEGEGCSGVEEGYEAVVGGVAAVGFF